MPPKGSSSKSRSQKVSQSQSKSQAAVPAEEEEHAHEPEQVEEVLQAESSPARSSEMGQQENIEVDELEEQEVKPQLTPTQDEDPEHHNTFRILLATDSHLGYMESDPIRGQDSFIAFREVLELARDRDADFLLLAGDLFHENYPSKYTIRETMALLREFTQGERPVRIELLSDPDEGKVGTWSFPTINYEDFNINVSLPVFSIHGNHDDPTGTYASGALSSLDILSTSGLLNYFGKTDLPSHTKLDGDGQPVGLTVVPVLLRKGTTHLAMYGMGNVKDARMNAELRNGRVVMRKPAPREDVNWFNVVLVHQNRVAHNRNEFVPENMFDEDTDLVVWGHEHDCRIKPEPVADRDYWITQPGSSVATSLSEGEALEKKVGMLLIRGKEFQLDEIPLKSVRPFVLKHIVMEDEAKRLGFDLDSRPKCTEFLRQTVRECVEEALEQWSAKAQPAQPGSQEVDDDAHKKPKPLVRLKVETTGMSLINRARFGESVNTLVANPGDILQFYQRKKGAVRRRVQIDVDRPEVLDGTGDDVDATGKPKVTMADLVTMYLSAQELKVLPEQGMEGAVEEFVKGSKSAIKDFVNLTLKTYHKSADANKADDPTALDEDGIEAELERQKSSLVASQAGSGAGSLRAGKKMAVSRDVGADSEMHDPSEEGSDAASESTTASAAKEKRQAPAKKAPAKKAFAPKGKGKAKEKLFDDGDSDEDMADSDVQSNLDDFDDESEDDAPVRRGGRKTPAASSAKAKAPAKKTAPAKRPATTQSQLAFAPPPRTASARVAKSKPVVYQIVDSDSD